MQCRPTGQPANTRVWPALIILRRTAGADAMDSYIVAYDISGPGRLRKVARCCGDYGYRKHKSVFLCRLSATDVVRMRTRLYDMIDLSLDQVLFIP